MTRPLNPLTLPLDGLRLIEASAGTGKTYTIANLYLRLLLATTHPVTELLVVTFTNAATEELRERIRARIAAAIAHLDGRGDSADDFVDALVSQHDLPPPPPQADLFDSPPTPLGPKATIQRLRDALTRMDEAAIFTIHGFCQRVLADAAFESGAWFDAELMENPGELLIEVTQDFWRRHFYRAGPHLAAWVASTWGSPDALRKALEDLQNQARITLVPTVSETELADAERVYRTVFAELLAHWPDESASLAEIFYDTSLRLSNAVGNYHPDRLDPLFTAMHRIEDPAAPLPPDFDLLTRNRVEGATGTRGKPVPDHPLYDLAQTVQDAADRLDAHRRAYWLSRAYSEIGAALKQRKIELGLLGFDDLLSRLADVLEDPDPEQGLALAERIRKRFPVAMIDEFQDTDPLQYAIFSRVYLDNAAADTALYLIGDPKQAIYAFRGADVFTYMNARNRVAHLPDAPQHHFTLDTNWRSSTALIDALNTLFLRHPQPFHYAQIPYESVRAGGKADKTPLHIDGQSVTPLAGWLLTSQTTKKGQPTEWAKKHVGPLLARHCASEIARLLGLAADERAGIGERALTPADFAVLVRNRFEAADIANALEAAGIASVYLSRDSVFESNEALALHQVLSAVAQPWDRSAVRVALGGELIGLAGAALIELDNDEHRWEAHVESLVELHRHWRERGFMPMFLRLLHRLGVTGRALGRSDGERRLTNLMQLAELMQIASAQHPGMTALLDWLAEQRQAADGRNEAQQLRLESDARRVRIVTVHKSKGLQYPLVFLPFIGYGPSSRRKEAQALIYHDADNMLCADLGSADRDAHRAIARRETLAEETRLLYVALTRAQYRCYLGWGRMPGFAGGALAHLLLGESDDAKSLSDDALHAPLRDLMAGAMPLFEPLADTPHRTIPRAESSADARARIFTGAIPDDWRVSSFTALAESSSTAPEAGSERPDHDQTERTDRTAPAAQEDSPPRPDRFGFPRGAHAGLLLHGVLEKLDFERHEPAALRTLIDQRLPLSGISPEWSPVLADWLEDVLATRFGDGIRLADLTRRKRLDELEFHFPIAHLDADDLNAILNDMGDDNAPLAFPTRHGLMKGYIDLVFEHDGRFHLADYKSNHLGNTAEDYRAEHLTQAMRTHRYDLQAMIYAVALHRYLRRRIPDYRFDTHFGGVHYLFLRGMSAKHPAGTGVYSFKPDPQRIERLDRLFAAGVA